MQKLTCIFNFNLICFSTILFSALPVQGMEGAWDQCLARLALVNAQLCKSLINAQRYDSDDMPELVRISDDELIEISKRRKLGLLQLANAKAKVEELKNDIKSFMKLSTTCKSWNNFLTFERIGSFCEHYPLETKNEVLRYLIESWGSSFDGECRPTLILICAGADIDTNHRGRSALKRAVYKDDVQFAKTLFRYNANPNIQTYYTFVSGYFPVFFCANTVEMVQTFIENGVDIQATDFAGLNVLWHILYNEGSADLMKVYLEHGVDATKLHLGDNACLLHALAHSYYIPYIDNFLQNANLLLTAIPGMINTLDEDNLTPLDVAQESLKGLQEDVEAESALKDLQEDGEEDGVVESALAFEKFIALLRERGGLTAQELGIINIVEKLDQ